MTAKGYHLRILCELNSDEKEKRLNQKGGLKELKWVSVYNSYIRKKMK